MNLSENQQKVLRFIEDFAEQHLEIPSAARIFHETPGGNAGGIERTLSSLYHQGLLTPIIEKVEEERERRESMANSNRPDQYKQGMVRSGVHEMTRKQIEAKAYPVDLMTARMPDGVKWEFLFTVDHKRGRQDYTAVKKAGLIPSYSKYGSSLLEGMFKKWQ